jgi:hypothetical protein
MKNRRKSWFSTIEKLKWAKLCTGVGRYIVSKYCAREESAPILLIF